MVIILVGLAGSPKAAPVLRDNLDGTRTAIWTFDTGENLTFSNATLAGGAVSLDLSYYSWIQTTKKDFENGSGTNVTYLAEGSLTLGRRPNPERIVASRDTGNVYSFTAFGALEWTGAMSGHVRAIASDDWNKDTYPEGVAAASDNAANMVKAFNTTGSTLWNSVDPSQPLRAISAIDLDEDGILDEVVVGGDSRFLYAIEASGTTLWSNDTLGKIKTIAVGDFDGDGLSSGTAVGTDQRDVRVYDKTGVLVWTFMMSQVIVQVVTIANHTTGILDRVVALSSDGSIVFLNRAGKSEWSGTMPGAGSALAAADFESTGVIDDVAVGDNQGNVWNLNETGSLLGTYKFPQTVQDLTADDADSNGRFESIYGGDQAGNTAVFNASGTQLWSVPAGNRVNAVSAVDLDGDGYIDDVVAGLGNGSVMATNSAGVKQWFYDVGGAVDDVTRLRNADQYFTPGTWYSSVLDAWGNSLWAELNWTSVNPPGTNLTFSSRSGYTATPDASWSAWSSPIWRPGAALASPPARYLQLRVTLLTTDTLVRPKLLEFRVTYSKYSPTGYIQTESLAPPDLLRWDVFNASVIESANTSISFSYSNDDGFTWQPIFVGANLSALASPGLIFKAVLGTMDTTESPSLLEMSIRYEYVGLVDHVHVSPPSWSGTADDSVSFTTVAHDFYHRPVSVALKWETSDPFGTIDSGGLYRPGKVGSWRVFANTTDNSVSGYADVFVSAGALARIAIEPRNPGTMIAGSSINFTATGFDRHDNQIGPVTATWTVSGGIGVVNPVGPSTNTVLDATTVGVGNVSAVDGSGHVNTTAPITVVAGSLVRIGVLPWNPGTVATGSTVLFTANGYDICDNRIGLVPVTWHVNGGIGTIQPAGFSSSATFNATSPGAGSVSADDGLGHVNVTAPITVVAGSLVRIEVTPANVNVLVGVLVTFTAKGHDEYGYEVPLSGSLWTTNAGSLLFSNDTTATLQAQNTPVSGAYVRVSVSPVQGSATVNVVEIDRRPVIPGVVPNQAKPEDFGTWVVNLAPFASDPLDPPTSLKWEMTGQDDTLYSVSGLGVFGNHLLSFTTLSNAFGNNKVTLSLVNREDYMDSQSLWINITPVNDIPAIDVVAPFTLHYDIPYNYYFYDYVFDVETPKEQLVLSSSDPAHISISGLWATLTYPQSMDHTTSLPIMTVTDADGASSSTVLILKISDDYVPTIRKPLPDITLFEGQEVRSYFDLDDYFSDPEGESLFFAFGNTHTDIGINANHTVDFKALGDWFGCESVTFRAVDPENARAEDNILITVIPVNDPPSISGVPNLFVRYDDPLYPDYNYTFDLSPYVNDVDNQPEDLVAETSEPSHIRFYLLLNLVMSIHFPVSMNGRAINVRITVSDGNANASQLILITVTDDWPPELVMAIPDQVFLEDTTLPNAINISSYFTDKDGDNLYFTYGNESVTVHIDMVTRMVEFSAKQDWHGLERVTFRATDPTHAIVEYTITVTVIPVNDPPVIGTIPEIEVVAGDALVLDLRQYVSDVDNAFQELSLTVTGNHRNALQVVGRFLIFSYGENASFDTVTLTVSDGAAATSRSISVRIIPRPVPQVFGTLTWPFAVLSAVLLSLLAAVVIKKTLLRMVVEEVLLIHGSGILLGRASRRDKSRMVNEDLFSSMLTALQDFARHSFKNMEDAPLRRMEFDKKKILIERGQTVCLAVVYSGFEKKNVLEQISTTVERIDSEYGTVLRRWDGLMEKVTGVERYLAPLVDECDDTGAEVAADGVEQAVIGTVRSGSRKAK